MIYGVRTGLPGKQEEHLIRKLQEQGVDLQDIDWTTSIGESKDSRGKTRYRQIWNYLADNYHVKIPKSVTEEKREIEVGTEQAVDFNIKQLMEMISGFIEEAPPDEQKKMIDAVINRYGEQKTKSVDKDIEKKIKEAERQIRELGGEIEDEIEEQPIQRMESSIETTTMMDEQTNISEWWDNLTETGKDKIIRDIFKKHPEITSFNTHTWNKLDDSEQKILKEYHWEG